MARYRVLVGTHTYTTVLFVLWVLMRLVSVRVGKLPVEHMTLLRTLMRHCVRVAAHSVENRMPASNLAAVIGPNILRDQDATYVL